MDKQEIQNLDPSQARIDREKPEVSPLDLIWERFEAPLIDNTITETSDDLAAYYVNNYIQAIQALHNMKNVIYRLVEKYELTDQQPQRLQKIHSMTEEDYRIYHNSDHIINSGNFLFNLRVHLKILSEIRKRYESINQFNNLPVLERQQILADIQNSIINTGTQDVESVD